MFIRPYYRTINGKRRAYWALVESYRTERGSRQRVVAHLGKLDEAGRLGVKQAAQEKPNSSQKKLFPEPEPEWIEVDAKAVRVENCREFGGPWLALELIKKLGLDEFLRDTIPSGREDVPWSMMALVLVIARLCDPSSELSIAENFFRKTAMSDLLGLPAEKVYDNRLYRALDKLLPHKQKLEVFLKEKLGELFDLEYDLLLYDVTSTYFEGDAKANPLAQRGYSRDQRSDCKQVCIGLVVSRCGMPLGYEVFAGNTADVTTVEQIVTTMEARYGKSNRIWVMDRGMVSDENLDFLKEGDRRYIVGTPKSMLKKFEQQLLGADWHAIREGLEVKLCASPDGEAEMFILCRSRDRREKEKAMHARFAQRIEERLLSMQARCRKQKRDPLKVSRDVGRLLGQNSRAAGLFDVDVRQRDDGGTELVWQKVEAWQEWSELSEGCYLLRTLEGLHPTDRSRGGLPDSQKRSFHPADLAPERRPRTGPHPGLLPGLRAVEDVGRPVRPSRVGQRTATRVGRTEGDPCRGRRAAHASGSGNPQTLRHETERTPGNPAPQTGAELAVTVKDIRNVVKTFQTRPLCRKHLRQQLSKLG